MKQNEHEVGWSSEMRDLAHSFNIHRMLLKVFIKVGIIKFNPDYFILHAEFKQKTFEQIKNGEEPEWLMIKN